MEHLILKKLTKKNIHDKKELLYFAVVRLIFNKNDEVAALRIFSDFFEFIKIEENHLDTISTLKTSTFNFILNYTEYWRNKNMLLVINIIKHTNEPERTTFIELYNQVSEVFGSCYSLLERIMNNPHQTLIEVAKDINLNVKRFYEKA